MPYIQKQRRKKIDPKLHDLEELVNKDKNISIGDMNYIVTKLMQQYMINKTVCYDTINSLVGMLDCAKMELYRRIAVNYEQKKIKTNGDVYENDIVPTQIIDDISDLDDNV